MYLSLFFPSVEKKRERGRMKLLITIFLLSCLFGEVWSYKGGRQVYFNITLDFASIPGAPGTQTILAPGGSKNFVINWNAMRYDAMVAPRMTRGLCNVGGFGDWATYNNDASDVNYFVFGNGVNMDYVMHGPFWCDSSVNYLVDNTTFETYLKYNPYANQDDNPVYSFFAPYYGAATVFQAISYHDLQWSGEAGFDPSVFWGLFVDFGSLANSLVVNSSMNYDNSVDQVIYGPLNPLVVQSVTPDVAGDGSSTGSITIRLPIIFLD